MKYPKSVLSTGFVVGLIVSVVVLIVLLLLGWKLTSAEVDAEPISVGLAPGQPVPTAQSQIQVIEITATLPSVPQTNRRPTPTVREKNLDQPSQTPRIVIVTTTPNHPLLTVAYNADTQSQVKTPDRFIRDYYDAINQREYELAFSLLSTSFKDKYHCCGTDGSYNYNDYVDWWNSVNKVELLKVEIREQSSSRATVYALLRFYYRDGRVVDDQHIFQLIAGGNEGWLIDEQGG